MKDATPAPKSWFVFIALGAIVTWIAVILKASGPYDFIGFYAAGSLLLHHPHSLYSLTAQRMTQQAAGSPVFLPWAHMAAEAILFAPLALLSCHPAFAVWTAVSIGLFILSGYLLREEIIGLTAGGRCSLLAFVSNPIIVCLLVGQNYGLSLLLWVLAYRRLKANDDFGAGLWIGLSLIRYQFALPVLLFLAVLRNWRLLKGAVVSGSALASVSFLVAGPALNLSYLRMLRYQGLTSDSIFTPLMPTIRGFAAWVLPSHANSLTAVAASVLLIWALVRVREMARLDAFCFAMIVSFLVDPHAFLYELPVLAIPLLLFLKKCPKSAILPLIICALASAASFRNTELFAPICPVLLVWAIWISRVYRGKPRRVAAPGLVGSLSPSD